MLFAKTCWICVFKLGLVATLLLPRWTLASGWVGGSLFSCRGRQGERGLTELGGSIRAPIWAHRHSRKNFYSKKLSCSINLFFMWNTLFILWIRFSVSFHLFTLVSPFPFVFVVSYSSFLSVSVYVFHVCLSVSVFLESVYTEGVFFLSIFSRLRQTSMPLRSSKGRITHLPSLDSQSVNPFGLGGGRRFVADSIPGGSDPSDTPPCIRKIVDSHREIQNPPFVGVDTFQLKREPTNEVPMLKNRPSHPLLRFLPWITHYGLPIVTSFFQLELYSEESLTSVDPSSRHRKWRFRWTSGTPFLVPFWETVRALSLILVVSLQ